MRRLENISAQLAPFAYNNNSVNHVSWRLQSPARRAIEKRACLQQVYFFNYELNRLNAQLNMLGTIVLLVLGVSTLAIVSMVVLAAACFRAQISRYRALNADDTTERNEDEFGDNRHDLERSK